MSQNVLIKSPPQDAESEPSHEVKLPARELFWETVGSALADKVCHLPEVLAVFERPREDEFGIIVYLKDDRESVLDTVFDAEREISQQFPHCRFDVRVTRVDGSWNGIKVLRSTPGGMMRFLRE